MIKHYESMVDVYDEKILINTKTKTGYAAVLKKIDPLLSKMAKRTYISGYAFDDVKQELSLMAIEGINSFDPARKVKMSSFLHNHLKNKLISKLKSSNKLSNDAFDSSVEVAIDRCKCGSSSEKSVTSNLCDNCKKECGPTYRNSRDEITFSSIPIKVSSHGDELDFESSISSCDSVYANTTSAYDDIAIGLAIEKLSKCVDEDTRALLRLICIDGYTVTDAAKSIGITGWAANIKLKKIKSNKILIDILEG